jgi:hypothetical protein
MSPVPDDPGLREDITKLRDELSTLNRHMAFLVDEKVQTKVETEVAAKGVPREEYRRRVKASGKRVVGGFGVVLLLAVVLGFLIWETQSLARENRRLIAEVASTCTDPKASAALRKQWTRVEAIIVGSQQRKPGQPGYIKPGDAGKLFADSYKQAIREAGPAPDCRDLLP